MIGGLFISKVILYNSFGVKIWANYQITEPGIFYTMVQILFAVAAIYIIVLSCR